MYKRILIILMGVAFVFGISKLSFATMCHGKVSQHLHTSQSDSAGHKYGEAEAATLETAKEPVDVGNKICPVSGEEIDEKTKATYEYDGKIYNFCCEMCIDEFKKEPQKYIKKVEEELKAESKEESGHEGREMEMIQGSGTSHQGMHQGHNH